MQLTTPRNSVGNAATPTNHADSSVFFSAAIQPSRYGLMEKLKPIEYSTQKVLTDLESQVEVIESVFKQQDPNNKSQQERINLYK